MNKLQFRNRASDQRGVASLLSVIFFILIASIIMVGFTRMALLEGRQSLEDSLSKAAISAAYSGVNDAKRAILYCNQFAIRPIACNSLNNQSCPGFYTNPDLRDQLGLTLDTATNSVQVGDPTLNERYTCTIVTEDTFSVKGSLVKGSTDEATTLIPLRATQPFNQIVLTWQTKLPSSTIAGLNYGGDAGNNSYRDPSSFSSYFQSNPKWPALLGAHLMVQRSGATIGYNGDGTVSGLDQRRWLFYPYGDTGATGVGVGAGGGLQRQMVRCNDVDGYSPETEPGSYVCQMRITGLEAMEGARYLQLTSLYRTTEYVVELLDSSGTPVTFDNVNPQIDSTGAVDNVFRRVKVGVRPEGVNSGGRNPILPNAIDTGSGLCKDMAVGGSYFADNCYASPTLGVGNVFNGADAKLGSFCDLNDCPPSGGGDDGSDGALGPPANFTQNIFNTSNNNDAEVAGCTWTISDGTTINNQYCLRGNKFAHTFPTTPYPPKTKYVVTLRIVLKDGSTASYTGSFYMPRR